MCSIFGLGFQQGHEVKDTDKVRAFIDELFVNCMDRGTHASGLALVSRERFSVAKRDMRADSFVKTKEYRQMIGDYLILDTVKKESPVGRTMSIIGHCRFPTKGSELNNANNHPIVRDKIIGVHNGSIGNDDYLFSANKQLRRNGEVDSEVIFALIEMYAAEYGSISAAIKRTCALLRGSLSCAAVHALQPHLIWLFRAMGPCDILHYQDVGLIVWASSKRYIDEAIYESQLQVGEPTVIDYKPNHLICLDMHRNLMRKETL